MRHRKRSKSGVDRGLAQRLCTTWGYQRVSVSHRVQSSPSTATQSPRWKRCIGDRCHRSARASIIWNWYHKQWEFRTLQHITFSLLQMPNLWVRWAAVWSTCPKEVVYLQRTAPKPTTMSSRRVFTILSRPVTMTIRTIGWTHLSIPWHRLISESLSRQNPMVSYQQMRTQRCASPRMNTLNLEKSRRSPSINDRWTSQHSQERIIARRRRLPPICDRGHKVNPVRHLVANSNKRWYRLALTFNWLKLEKEEQCLIWKVCFTLGPHARYSNSSRMTRALSRSHFKCSKCGLGNRKPWKKSKWKTKQFKTTALQATIIKKVTKCMLKAASPKTVQQFIRLRARLWVN